MSSIVGGLPPPPMLQGDAPDKRFTAAWAGWLSTAQLLLSDVGNSGTTAQRPTTNLYIGKTYFDTTLGEPIFLVSVNPIVWFVPGTAVGGTVTSVDLSSTGGDLVHTGGPVTAAGVIDVELATQAGVAGSYTNSNLMINAKGIVIAAASGSGGGGGGNITPDTHPGTELSVNDEFEYGSALDTTGARFSGASAWAWGNQGNSSTSVSEGSLLFQGDWNGNGGLTCFYQPVAGATWAYTAKLALGNCYLQNLGPGMYVCNSANGKILTHGFYNASATQCETYCYQYSGTAAGSQGASLNSASGSIAPPFVTTISSISTYGSGWVYYQISYNGTTITASASPTGLPGTFQAIWQQTPATYLGAAPTQVGLAIPLTNQFNSSQVQWLMCDWFRKTA